MESQGRQRTAKIYKRLLCRIGPRQALYIIISTGLLYMVRLDSLPAMPTDLPSGARFLDVTYA